VVVIYAKGPDGNPLWDYAVRRGWDDDVRVVSEPVELMRLVRAGRVGVVLANRAIEIRDEAADGGGGTGGCSRLILGGVLDLNEA
jgi:hypothetical protein